MTRETSQIVKNNVARAQGVALQKRTIARELVVKLEERLNNDRIKAVDMPQELIDYVMHSLWNGHPPDKIREALGIFSDRSPLWIKISAAVKMGRRINSPQLFEKWIFETESLNQKARNILDKLSDEDIVTIDDWMGKDIKKQEQARKKGLNTMSKEFVMVMDSIVRSRESIVRLGKDMNIFDAAQQKANQGVTIIVKNNVVLPEPVDAKKPDIVHPEIKK